MVGSYVCVVADSLKYLTVRLTHSSPFILLFCFFFSSVPLSLPQPPLPLSLPVHMSIIPPPPWKFLPVSQENLSPNFSNSSPFSFSRSLFMVPPPGGWDPSASLQASYGPYSVSQVRRTITGEVCWYLKVEVHPYEVRNFYASLFFSTANTQGCPPAVSHSIHLPFVRVCAERDG